MLRSSDALRALCDRPRRLLAVFAHPDDEAYGCSGQLARAAARDDTATVLLCLTSGEASTGFADRGLDRGGIARLREGRMERVAERLGVDGLLLPGLPDGRLAREPLAVLGDAVGAVLDAFDPHVVIGHDPRGVNAHPDHIAAHWAVRRGLEGRTARRFAMIAYLQEMADAVQPRLLFPTPESEVDAVVRLDAREARAKEDCLRIHEALVTVLDDGPEELLRRPAVERYDFLGESLAPPVDDVFEGLPAR
jgi:LmbE family N-acetylglucosaminyl deacetylase